MIWYQWGWDGLIERDVIRETPKMIVYVETTWGKPRERKERKDGCNPYFKTKNEAIKWKHNKLKNAVSAAEKTVEYRKKTLAEFEEKHT